MATGRVPTTANSPLTAKGDLFGYSTTQARVAVGNDGETLVADSSATTGLRWQGDYAAGKNKIINGDFGIWQRGTSFTTGSSSTYVYTADRWLTFFYGSNTSTVTRETFTPGAAPVAGYEGQFFGRFNSSNTANFFSYRIEDVRTLAGQTATFSFWAKSNSNQTITSTVSQNFGSGGSATVASVISGSPALTTSWQRFSFTAAIPSISGKTVGTSSYVLLEFVGAINNAIDIWGVQLEAGSVATAFQTATGTIQGELAACQRYYYLHASGTASAMMNGFLYDAGYIMATVFFPVTMRILPSLSFTSGTNYYTVYVAGSLANFSGSTWNINTNGYNSAWLFAPSTGIGGAAGAGVIIQANNASARFAFSAEL